VSVVRPEAGPLSAPIIPLKNGNPGYDFSKRTLDTNTIGGNPRSLDFNAGETVEPVEQEAEVVAVKDEVEHSENSVEEGKSRKRRAPVDGNGNTILRIVRREAEETDDVDQADIETERVIRVVAPSDVQFQLNEDGKEEVVINTNSVPTESLCIDTAAFVGVTISILMLLIVALITILFLWMRIRSIGRKNLL